MEISIVDSDSVKIKGKTASFIVNPTKSSDDYHGAFYLTTDSAKEPLFGQGIAIDSPGEYEIGGVKIKGSQKETGMIYTLSVDGINLIIGSLSTLEKVQGKFQDLSIACVNVDSQTDPSFMSGYASNYIIYFGKNASELCTTFLKGEVEKQSRFVSPKELPQEMQIILLA